MDKSVGIESIEQELTALWSDFGTDTEAAPVIRACSMNLVAVVGEDADRGSVEHMLIGLTGDHPARAFLVVLDRAAPDLETTVSARCSIPLPGEKQVCSEQITLIAPPGAAGRIPSIVSSLLVPDVPVVVWVDRSFPFPEFRQISAMSDLVILDSAGDRDFTLAMQLLKHNHRVQFRDLAWERTEFWRRLTSLLFEKPELLNKLTDLSTVEVTWAGSDKGVSGESSAMLFGGWISHSLNRLPGPEYPLPGITFSESGEQMAISGLCSIRFTFRDGVSYLLAMSNGGKCPVVTQSSDGKVVSEDIYPIRDVDEEQRMSTLLTTYEQYPGYLNVLHTVTGWK
ncbi:MAG: glucose-6-phosphate dehydrogenase assembly protein OpcA [Ignavibacteria bacterium]|nr:glucose-6-phosphate dehydrogenase assembly protein OpcA [Ignavibacteria bacterium]